MAYFEPLRRKIGVVTLVMACVFMGAWFRSWMAMDSLTMMCGTQTYLKLMSGDQWIGCLIIHASKLSVGWECDEGGNPFDWINVGESQQLLLPHAVFVLTLTIISAWLLLSKPRAKPSAPTHV